jgi:hypothetical protein
MTKFYSAADARSEEIACLGLMLLDRAIEIADANQIATRTFRFGPLAVAVQTAGREYSQRLTSVIDFACSKGCDAEAFRIIALDSADPGVGSLPHSEYLRAYSRQLEQQFECRSAQLMMRYDAHGDIWRVASLARRSAVVWTADARRLPDWEIAAPLRDVLHWASIPTPCFLTHGAAIGAGGNGILFTGPGGSGKSTTTAAALLSGLQTGGDDFVLLDPIEREMHALYDSVRLDADGQQRLANFSAVVSNPSRSATEKARFRASAVRPNAFAPRLRLSAIVVPYLAHAEKTVVAPAARSEVMRALAPSTLLLLRGGQMETAAKLAGLVRSTPGFRIELGRDPAEVAVTLADMMHGWIK